MEAACPQQGRAVKGALGLPRTPKRLPRGLGHTPSAGALSLASSTASGTPTLLDDPFAFPGPHKPLLKHLSLHLHRAASVSVPPSPQSSHFRRGHNPSRSVSALATPPRTRTTKRAPPASCVMSVPANPPTATLSVGSPRLPAMPAPEPLRRRPSNGSAVHQRRPQLVPSRSDSPEAERTGRRTASRSERLLRDTLKRDERVRSRSRSHSRPGDLPAPRAYIAAPAPAPLAPLSPPFVRSYTSLGTHPESPRRPSFAHSPMSSPTALPTRTMTASPTLRRARTPPRDLSLTPLPARADGPGCTCGALLSRRPSRAHTRQSSLVEGMPAPAHGPLTPPPTPPHAGSRLPSRSNTGSSTESRRSDLRHSLSASSSSSSVAGALHSLACPLHIAAEAPTPEEDEEEPMPAAPRFDVHQAAAACKANTGYVAFADLAGLGVPPAGLDGDESQSERDAPKDGAARRRSGMGRGIAKVLAWWGTGGPDVPAAMH